MKDRDYSEDKLAIAAKKAYEEAVDDTYDIEPLTGENIRKNTHGDSLLSFVIFEAADAGSLEEAADMMFKAARDLEETGNALLRKAAEED